MDTSAADTFVRQTKFEGNLSTWSGQLIGLWGPAGVGKDTICKQLKWPRAAFADKLKQDLAPLLSILGLDMSVYEDKEMSRDLLVAWGALCRKVDPAVWIKRITLPVNITYPYKPQVQENRCCITDVRYINECKAIWERGGIVFDVYREGFFPKNEEERRSFAEIRDYAREKDVYIPVICNDGATDQAARAVEFVIQQKWGGNGKKAA
jgi:hypothetical protein